MTLIEQLERAAQDAVAWMNNPQTSQWPYLEGSHFYSDKTKISGALEDALAALRARSQGGE